MTQSHKAPLSEAKRFVRWNPSDVAEAKERRAWMRLHQEEVREYLASIKAAQGDGAPTRRLRLIAMLLAVDESCKVRFLCPGEINANR